MPDEVFTSDGEPRPNMMMEVMSMAGLAPPNPIPTSIGLSARVGVLATIGQAISAGGGTISPLSQWAAYDQSSVTQRINDISRALNIMGASPPLPIYDNIDYNSFSSIMNNIVNEMAGMQ